MALVAVGLPSAPMVTGVSFEPVSWREIVAIGVVANDLSPMSIVRCSGIGLAAVRAALAAAEAEGVLVDGVVEPTEAVRLVGELPPAVVAGVHSAVARYLLSEGPSRLLEAIEHARSAGTLSPSPELAAVADRAASTSLSVGDYDSARQFLEFAHDIGIGDAPEVRAQRLCRLGEALDGLGRVGDARARLAVAFEIAELEGLTDLAVEAAVGYALPVDWYAGDRRTTAFLQRVEALDLTVEHQVLVRAARAMAEMRIPVPSGHDQQVAWVTRPTVAQPLADAALDGSIGCSPRARLLALLSWRTTHRAPDFLERRRSATSEAFDLAQQLRLPGRQVDAAVMLAVDALEAADRAGFDHALTVMRWIADVEGNPRLAWHAHAVAAGAAHLDGDVEAAERHRHAAREVGVSIAAPGWLGAELLLLGQEILACGDHDLIRRHLPDEAGTEVLNPLGKLIVGLGHAMVGDPVTAEQLLRRALRQFDREASWLLCSTRATELAVRLGLDDVVEELWLALGPWHRHVAVDSQAWFCDGPVSAWLAVLAHHRGDVVRCRRYLAEAEPIARRLGDTRTITRLDALRGALGSTTFDKNSTDQRLDDRERLVLAMVVEGLTNPQIADALAFSPSTIRNDLSSIFRKLGVTSRSEAAAAGIRLGIVERT
jgi:DNA-binding CsgD family transcriptional regulator